MRTYLLLILLVLTSLSGTAQGPVFLWELTFAGVNSGADMPGTLNQDYAYPTEEEVNYFYRKGFKSVTVPFRWERIQKTLGGDLDYQEIGEIKKVVGWCSSRGLNVILSMHNGGRYRKSGIEYIVGSYSVSRNDFSDVWNRLANAFSGYGNLLGYEIMTEPHEMQGFDWFTTAQQAIHAIRQADSRTAIIIAGEDYAAAESWHQYSDNLKNLKDPSDKIIYNAHCFFDIDFTGKYLYSYDQNQAEEYTGVKRAEPFVNWLKENNKRGMIGAFTVPDTDSRWLNVMERFLKYLSDHQVMAVYWASGKKWGGHPLSVYPLAQNDRPQMSVLQKFVTGTVAYEEKTIVAATPAEPVTGSSATTPGNNPNPPAQSEEAPESFLFLPGTLLLPQPNGGLYKPATSKTAINADKGVRLAKYR